MKIIKRFIELEKQDKIIFFLALTTIVNILMAVVKLVFSLTLPSLWFFVNAIFNFILALLRFFSIRDYKKIKMSKSADEKLKIGFKNYLNNGILLILLGISYFMVSVYIYYKGSFTNMHEYLTYLVSFMAFYSIFSSIYGMVKYKKDKTPIISAVKITNFANALTSIVLTQVVLLDNFGGGMNTNLYDGIVGIFVSIIIISLGLYMIVDIKRYVKNLN